jgi:hypothetical protein
MKKIFMLLIIVMLSVSTAFADYNPINTPVSMTLNYRVIITQLPLEVDGGGGVDLPNVDAGYIKTLDEPDYSVFSIVGEPGFNIECTLTKITNYPRLQLIGEWEAVNSGVPSLITNLPVIELTGGLESKSTTVTSQWLSAVDGTLDIQYKSLALDATVCNGSDPLDLDSHTFTLHIEVAYY